MLAAITVLCLVGLVLSYGAAYQVGYAAAEAMCGGETHARR